MEIKSEIEFPLSGTCLSGPNEQKIINRTFKRVQKGPRVEHFYGLEGLERDRIQMAVE